jgi:hypothetical protein
MIYLTGSYSSSEKDKIDSWEKIEGKLAAANEGLLFIFEFVVL